MYTKMLFQKRNACCILLTKKDTEHISFILLLYRITTIRDINELGKDPCKIFRIMVRQRN